MIGVRGEQSRLSAGRSNGREMYELRSHARLRLHGSHDGRLYASAGRTLLEETSPGRLTATGRIRDRPGGDFPGYLQRRVLTGGSGRRALERAVGAVTTTNVWRVGDGRLLATLGRRLLASEDRGRTWTAVRDLPASSGPMGVLPTALCRDGDRLLLGEYPLGGEIPRILESTDGGRTWETLLSVPEVRHVHAVRTDPYGGDVWVTAGDTDAESRIARLRDGSLDVVGTGSQRWRAVDLAFTPDAVIWGMDCTYAEANHVLRLPRDRLDDPAPTPESLHVASGSVFYAASLTVEDTQWIALSTALEPGIDSTADDDRRVNRTGTADVIAASAATGFEEWHTLASYGKRSVPTDRIGRLPTASAYVFLAADDRGLAVNPYNTDRHDGTIRRYGPDALASLERGRR